MIDDPDFYTKTMAGVYADQGHLKRASEIYRHLLKVEPSRQDLADALSKIEKRLSEEKKKGKTDLALLFGRWVDLCLSYNRLQRLKEIQNRL